MEKEEYTEKLAAIESNYELSKNTLAANYAVSNSPYKVDDIFTDHVGSIRIEKIRWQYGWRSEFPSCVYEGAVLKKDKTPRKNGEKRKAYQSNEVK